MIRATCAHTSPRPDGICAECLPAPRRGGNRWYWRPLRPGEVLHKTTSQGGIGQCGAKERDGAKFTNRAVRVTCATCREAVAAYRARAKEAAGG